jgi:LmbE family N-acetylglucosaminyl deacetylase
MNISNFKNVLVLAPHTDDGELGCGGTIAKLIESGISVTYVAFSIAEESVPPGFPSNILSKEVKEATRILGVLPQNLIVLNYKVRKLNYVRQEILEELIKIRKTNSFDLVFIPSLNDLHQDHSTVAQEGLRAFKNTSIFSYELIWNNRKFETSCFVSLKKEQIDKKVQALTAYKSQGFRDYLSHEFIFSLAKTRGVQVSCEYAEAFEIVRLFL